MTSSSAPDSGGIPPRLHAGKRLRLAIVGGGPLCVYALERLAAQLGAIERPQAGTGLRVDVFERSGRFGAGEVNHDLQPATSLLNRVAAQIGFSADETNTSVAALLPAGARPTFLEWAVRRSRERGDPAYALAPAAIPSRRMHGEALTETFTAYAARLREAGVELHCHARSVVDLVPEADHSFTIVCADAEHGDCAAIIRADRVLLATGNAASFAQSPPPPPDARGLRRIARVYPLDRQLTEATVPRGAQVAISGLGLTAADVLLYLTEGRGGRFEKEDEAGLRLRYVACGREPARIVAFSPSGMLPCCRPENFKLLDPELAYRGVFFNVEALQRMRGARGAPMRIREDHTALQLNFSADVLPLVVLEMARAYYLTLFGPDFDVQAIAAAQQAYVAFLDSPREDLAQSEISIEQLLAPLQACFERTCLALHASTPEQAFSHAPEFAVSLESIRGMFDAVLFAPASPGRPRSDDALHARTMASPWGHPLSPNAHRFCWRRILFPFGRDAGAVREESGTDWRARVLAFLDQDLRNAAQGNLRNPLKAACDGVMRDQRGVFAALVEDGGLTAASHRDFLDGFMRIYHRLSNGAGMLALRKIRALVESGGVNLDVGPGATLACESDAFVVTGPVTGVSRAATVLIEGRLAAFDAADPVEPLYPNLLRRGLVRRWINPAHAPGAAFVPGGLDLSASFHPRDAHGQEQTRLTAMGTPAEGQRLLQSAAARPRCGSAIFDHLDRWASDILAAMPPQQCSQPQDERR